MDIITRKEALEKGLTQYYTGIPCSKGHIAVRYTKAQSCSACGRSNHKEWSTTKRGKSYLLLSAAKTRSKKFNLEFDLDAKWVDERLSTGHCSVSGLPFVLTKSATLKHPMSPSIDRIDSTLGYTKDNCRLVVTIYNFAKNEWSDADVLALATALTKH
jgi:hypothetical protein